MAKIKVLRIITRLNIGGPARQAVLLNSELAKENFDCVLITGSLSEAEGDMSYIAAESSVKPVMIPAIGRELSIWNDLVSFCRIYSIIKKEKPHIVHTHMAKAGTVGRIAAKAAGAPVIIHTFHGHVFHSYFSEQKTRFFIGIEKILARFTDKIITVSERQKKEIKDYLSISDDGKIALIPLGFDLDKFITDKDCTA
ncbi:MAG: glycosyltransferase, partial [Candidatus Omnitrophica bacterium]|nr:glycosyltransferase [Candidatus Omnitrophota bacterium]MCG2705133.1 glycosyltransferase [Candidatus Omnitrophota bacterium]